MPIRAVWDRLGKEAANKVTALGIAGNDQVNSFAHIYVSAQLVREFGVLAAFVAGTSQEFLNHWTYRDGGREPHDPHQRRDSFRDLWNNGIGREIGKLAVYNSWTNDQELDERSGR